MKKSIIVLLSLFLANCLSPEEVLDPMPEQRRGNPQNGVNMVWATNEFYDNAGVWTGEPTKAEPPEEVIENGFIPGLSVPAEWLNWKLNQTDTYIYNDLVTLGTEQTITAYKLFSDGLSTGNVGFNPGTNQIWFAPDQDIILETSGISQHNAAGSRYAFLYDGGLELDFLAGNFYVYHHGEHSRYTGPDGESTLRHDELVFDYSAPGVGASIYEATHTAISTEYSDVSNLDPDIYSTSILNARGLNLEDNLGYATYYSTTRAFVTRDDDTGELTPYRTRMQNPTHTATLTPSGLQLTGATPSNNFSNINTMTSRQFPKVILRGATVAGPSTVVNKAINVDDITYVGPDNNAINVNFVRNFADAAYIVEANAKITATGVSVRVDFATYVDKIYLEFFDFATGAQINADSTPISVHLIIYGDQ